MFSKRILFSVFLLLCFLNSRAQLISLHVENYYESDELDATDVIGGGLSVGSKTYRVYAILEPGSWLTAMYGDESHPFQITSTTPFFNHETDGQTFAKDFVKARYGEGTVALDTWLTLGMTAKKQGPWAYYGIPKDLDDNGSFVGGINNDGGSEALPSGLLNNSSSWMNHGALTALDGIDTSAFAPTNWTSVGVLDFVTGADSTIFGSLTNKLEFLSTSFQLSNDGVKGTIADSNCVLLAQLTTLGELSFTMNLTVGYLNETGDTVYSNYVGTNLLTAPNEVYNPFLSYPYSCGCTDPTYLEYDPSNICFEEGSCIQKIVMGCLDSMACNYNADANFNIQELCCYPGWCQGRDLEEVCPTLMGDRFDFNIFPNPADERTNIYAWAGATTNFKIEIYNAFGKKVLDVNSDAYAQLYNYTLDTGQLESGVYHVRMITGFGEIIKILVLT